jgi:hypothetical protein
VIEYRLLEGALISIFLRANTLKKGEWKEGKCHFSLVSTGVHLTPLFLKSPED